MIHYSTALQKCIALSSTEADYVGQSEAAKVIVWLRCVLEELGIPQKATEVYNDNSGAVRRANADTAEEFRRSRHIELRYNYVRERVMEGDLIIMKTSTNEMLADFLTKILGPAALQIALVRVGVKSQKRI